MTGLSLGWLLPNHYLPWTAFHTEIWIAWWLMLGAWVIVALVPGPVRLERFALGVLCVAFIPFIQFAFSLITYSGQAWLTTAYLAGFFLTLVIGSHIEGSWPNVCMDLLFAAIGTAAIASVGLQLYQWLNLADDGLGLWIMIVPHGRPFANLAQPNQLATFLLWGLLAIGWGHQRGAVSGALAFFAGTYLLFGVALTQSRTAFVGVFGLVLFSYYCRRLLPSRAYVGSLVCLSLVYLLSVLALPWLSEFLGLAPDAGMAARSARELRLPAYRLFLDAVSESPLFGYGWAPTLASQLSVAERHGSLGGFFLHSHNLVLDLLLWCGVLVGGLIATLLAIWFFQKFRRIDSFQSAILLAFVGVVGWHAMLEFPLHYAYMLLPLGLAIGVLNVRLAEPVWLNVTRWHLGAALLAAVCLLGAITRDYFRVEENFKVLRFERANIGKRLDDPMASVWIFNHMNEFVRMGRSIARPGLTKEELNWMRDAARSFPSLANMFTYASALAMNQQEGEARLLISKLASICSAEDYAQMKRVWEAQARHEASLAIVVWPDMAAEVAKP